jgi:hypothetical protein
MSSIDIPCNRTSTPRCTCQPKPNLEITHPFRSYTHNPPISEREGEEKKPGWPDHIGTQGYAAYLLNLSNPAEKGGNGDNHSEKTVCFEGESEEVKRRGSVKLPPEMEEERCFSCQERRGVESEKKDGEDECTSITSRLSETSSFVGENTGMAARQKCWHGRNTTVLDHEDSLSHFAEQNAAVEAEPKSPSIEVFPCGSDSACSTTEEGRKTGMGLTDRDEVRRERERKREVRKCSKERERVKREGSKWKRILRGLGCGL